VTPTAPQRPAALLRFACLSARPPTQLSIRSLDDTNSTLLLFPGHEPLEAEQVNVGDEVEQEDRVEHEGKDEPPVDENVEVLFSRQAHQQQELAYREDVEADNEETVAGGLQTLDAAQFPAGLALHEHRGLLREQTPRRTARRRRPTVVLLVTAVRIRRQEGVAEGGQRAVSRR